MIKPIPMLLPCPKCRALHIDRDEWADKPHRTHRCEHCGVEWTPAAIATVGVEVLPTEYPVELWRVETIAHYIMIVDACMGKPELRRALVQESMMLARRMSEFIALSGGEPGLKGDLG